MFVSETDTEVIPHLCEYLWKKKSGKITLPQLVRNQLSPWRPCFLPAAPHCSLLPPTFPLLSPHSPPLL